MEQNLVCLPLRHWCCRFVLFCRIPFLCSGLEIKFLKTFQRRNFGTFNSLKTRIGLAIIILKAGIWKESEENFKANQLPVSHNSFLIVSGFTRCKRVIKQQTTRSNTNCSEFAAKIQEKFDWILPIEGGVGTYSRVHKLDYNPSLIGPPNCSKPQQNEVGTFSLENII